MIKKVKLALVAVAILFFCLADGGHVLAADCATAGGTCKATCANGEGSAAGTCATATEACCKSFGLPDRGMAEILIDVANFLLSLVGIVAVLGFVIAGFQYFFMSVDEKSAETAKKTMTASIVGFVVAVSGVVAVYTIKKLFGMP